MASIFQSGTTTMNVKEELIDEESNLTVLTIGDPSIRQLIEDVAEGVADLAENWRVPGQPKKDPCRSETPAHSSDSLEGGGQVVDAGAGSASVKTLSSCVAKTSPEATGVPPARTLASEDNPLRDLHSGAEQIVQLQIKTECDPTDADCLDLDTPMEVRKRGSPRWEDDLSRNPAASSTFKKMKLTHSKEANVPDFVTRMTQTCREVENGDDSSERLQKGRKRKRLKKSAPAPRDEGAREYGWKVHNKDERTVKEGNDVQVITIEDGEICREVYNKNKGTALEGNPEVTVDDGGQAGLQQDPFKAAVLTRLDRIEKTMDSILQFLQGSSSTDSTQVETLVKSEGGPQGLPEDELSMLKYRCSSFNNFAVKLLRKYIPESVLMHSNVLGRWPTGVASSLTRGTVQAIDPDVMKYVLKSTYRLYSIPPDQQREAYHKIKDGINSFCRYLRSKTRRKTVKKK